jgi:cysteinyl-tRNA synthetase
VNVKSLLAEAKESGTDLKALSLSGDGSLQTTLEKYEKEMDAALSDSFDTPRAMRLINELIKDTNIHISAHKGNFDTRGVEAIARWITKIVGIFGLDARAQPPYSGLGWTSSISDGTLSTEAIIKPFEQVLEQVKSTVQGLSLTSGVLDQLLTQDLQGQLSEVTSQGTSDPEEFVLPFVRAVSRIRDEIRRLAPESTSKKDILALADRIRDIDLTNLGVYLDDRSDGQAALIKFIPREELLAAREEKLAKEREKLAQKEAARLAREKQEAEKLEKAKVDPKEMFKDDRFSAWDEDGLPTKTKDGEEVPKSALKKMKKDWERQKKIHEDWKAKASA